MEIGKCLLLSAFGLFVFHSCGDNEVESITTKKTDFPSRRIFNAELTMTDSLKTTVKLRAPLIEMYEFAKVPYTVFNKGLDLDFFEKGKPKPGYLRADYAKIIEATGWYEAKNNVVIINADGDTLKTNHIFWDKKNEEIFTYDTVKIYRADGITTNISNNGIEASQDFKNFKLKNNHGTLPYKDLKQ
ncbi:MAG: LPS export ABC transporter periplasmic protein LptC [Flavobacteriaceae bacterium]|jgi:LPS export ABC transporter protein LptC|nr:LPS export ABC transporter periplasmic protein LptC [Flavobacteriaceae bacterium]